MKYLCLIYDEEKTWAAMPNEHPGTWGGFRRALRYVGRVPPSTLVRGAGSAKRRSQAKADPPEILLSASALRGARLG